MHDDRTLIFGRYRFNRRRGLWRGREEIRLAPRALTLLGFLVERAGEVVTKEELLSAVWSGTVVSDAALATCVQDLRHALRDDARRPTYVETLHRRGYRFLVRPKAVEPARPRPPARRPPYPGAPRSVPEAIGRADEIGALVDTFARAAAGTRQIVFVSGEAGVGKTSLVEAFLATHVASATLVMRGQCIERYGSGEAYLPLLDALGRLCRGRRRTSAVQILARHAPTWLAQLAIPASAARARRGRAATPERMLLELTVAVEALAATTPAVLWIEDLHWADTSTLDWLAFLGRRPESARLMVIGTARAPDPWVERSPLRGVMTELRAHRLCREISVEGLSEAATAEVLAKRLALASGTRDLERLARAVHRRTGGNPLFTVNVADDLVARGMLAPAEGGCELRLSADPVLTGVPEDVRALIERQFDRLDPHDREVLEIAALVGATFAIEPVAAAAGLASHDVGVRCAALAGRRLFLRPSGIERWPDGTLTERYAFLHELYREVVGDRPSCGRRAELHARVGRRLETGHGERATEIAAELAMHFERALDAERTLRYSLRAGANAVARNAPREALEHLRRALALTPAPGPSSRSLPAERVEIGIDVRLALRPVLSLLGEGRQALALLREADALAEQLGDDIRRGRVWAFTTTMHTVLGETDEAVAAGRRALAFAERRDDPALRVVTAGALEQAHFFRGEHQRVVALASANLARLPPTWTYECLGGVSPIGIYDRYFLVQSLAELGRFDEARREAATAIRLAGGTDHATGIGSAYYAATTLHVLAGEWEAAGETVEQAVAAFSAGDVALHVPWALACSAWVLARLGRSRTAAARLPETERLLDAHVAKGIAVAQGWGYHALGRAALLLGDVDEAGRLADRARATSVSQPGYAAHTAHLLGDIAAHPDRLNASSARAHYLDAKARAQALGMRPLLARCQEGLELLHRRAGQHRRAGPHPVEPRAPDQRRRGATSSA